MGETIDKIKQQKEHFESVSDYYYESRQHQNHLFYKELLWRFFFNKKEYLKEDVNLVLEPMCGYAEGRKILREYLGAEFEYDGFDYSSVLVQKVKETNPELNIWLQDITKFKSDKRYDLMIIIGGLHHVPDFVDEVVANLHEHLKPGGYFVNFECTHNNFIFRKIRERIYAKNQVFDDETERAFTLNDYNRLFENNHFEAVDQIHIGLLAYVLFYNPDAFPWLNFGGKKLVKLSFWVDKMFCRTWLGSIFSFATMTLWRKK